MIATTNQKLVSVSDNKHNSSTSSISSTSSSPTSSCSSNSLNLNKPQTYATNPSNTGFYPWKKMSTSPTLLAQNPTLSHNSSSSQYSPYYNQNPLFDYSNLVKTNNPQSQFQQVSYSNPYHTSATTQSTPYASSAVLTVTSICPVYNFDILLSVLIPASERIASFLPPQAQI